MLLWICAGNVVTNLRQVLHKRTKQRELRCRCVCCKKIGAFFREQNGNRPHKKGSRNRKVMLNWKLNFAKAMQLTQLIFDLGCVPAAAQGEDGGRVHPTE